MAWQHGGGEQGAECHCTVIPGDMRMSLPQVKVPTPKNDRAFHKSISMWVWDVHHELLGGTRSMCVNSKRGKGYQEWAPKLETFRGATGPLPAAPTPPALTPAEPLHWDLTWTRFCPDSLKTCLSGPNQAEAMSKSGLSQVRAEGFRGGRPKLLRASGVYPDSGEAPNLRIRSEKVFASQQRASGFPEKGADL